MSIALYETSAQDGADWFDFFIGDWRVRHRRLRRRLAGETHGDECGGTTSTRKILGGLGNLDENVIDLPSGAYEAITLRLFDRESQTWSIYWIDGRMPGIDDNPMVGAFKDGRGLFFADDVFEGRPIRVRFIWTPQTETACRWEQAFSPDAGESWETNWVMEFERA